MSDESFPTYKLRNLQRVDYRERGEDSSFEDSFKEDDTSLAGDIVNTDQQSNSFLNDICSVVPSSVNLPSCSTPVGCEQHLTINEFGQLVSPVELSGTLVDEELIQSIQRLSVSCVNDELISPSAEETTVENQSPVCSSTSSPVENLIAVAINNVISVLTYVNDSVNSSVQELTTNNPAVEVGSVVSVGSGSVFLEPAKSQVEHYIVSQVETAVDQSSSVYVNTATDVINRSAIQTVVTRSNLLSEIVEDFCNNDIDMALQLRRLVADLETIMFQIDEIHEGMDTVHKLSYNAKSQTLSELKDLRIAMIKAKKELDLSRDEDEQYNYTVRYEKLVVLAKEDIDSLKSALSSIDNSHDRAQLEQEARLRKEVELKNAERLSKVNAFGRSVNEVRNMYDSLLKAYSLVKLDTSRDSMLKRDKEKLNIASKFNKMRDRVHTLTLRSDVLMNNKEEILDELVDFVHKIESMKELYEEKVHQDLVENDLTPES